MGNEQITTNKEKDELRSLNSLSNPHSLPDKNLRTDEREDEQMKLDIGQMKLTVTANSERPLVPDAALPPPQSLAPSPQSPYIVDETDAYALVFKPPRMHCAPQGGPLQNSGDTLFDWYAALFPAVTNITGRKQGEGGLLHRLDFETQGLTLFAKNQSFADGLLTQQQNGSFIKEYSALCVESAQADSSFPPLPAGFPPCNANGSLSSGFGIESFFRPYGPGRKQVRPVTEVQANGKTSYYEIARCCYRTEIVSVSKTGNTHALTLKLARGFRHQIRCHLAWIGFPIANDPLYGAVLRNSDINDFLALRANAITFTDPCSGEVKKCRIEPLSDTQLKI